MKEVSQFAKKYGVAHLFAKRLDENEILTLAKEHFQKFKSWPTRKSGYIDTNGRYNKAKWSYIDGRLRSVRSSLPLFLAKWAGIPTAKMQMQSNRVLREKKRAITDLFNKIRFYEIVLLRDGGMISYDELANAMNRDKKFKIDGTEWTSTQIKNFVRYYKKLFCPKFSLDIIWHFFGDKDIFLISIRNFLREQKNGKI